MTWVAVGLSAAGAVKGISDAKVASKKQEEQNAFRKAALTYSPWTGMSDPGAGNFGNQNALSGALGGGLQGFSMGSTINGLGAAAKGAQGMSNEAADSHTSIRGMTSDANFAPQQNVVGPKSSWGQLQDQQLKQMELQKQLGGAPNMSPFGQPATIA